jgi:tRNA G18 (ribose-2'-O)-methylase SpoU
VEQGIRGAKAQGLTVVALETVEGSPVAHDYVFPRQCALLLGNERHGVEPRHIAMCDAVVQIPCRGVKNSLNVATAFGICAYEMTRQWSSLQ